MAINFRKYRLTAALLSFGALTACGGGYYSGGVVVGPPPPEPFYGPVGVAPGPDYVWMGGYYDLNGSRWVWRQGHWGHPPRRGYTYVRPRWEERGHGHYRFHQGHWQRHR